MLWKMILLVCPLQENVRKHTTKFWIFLTFPFICFFCLQHSHSDSFHFGLLACQEKNYFLLYILLKHHLCQHVLVLYNSFGYTRFYYLFITSFFAFNCRNIYKHVIYFLKEFINMLLNSECVF
jgi:hypothetical protein